jgi:hypothetical protein
VLVRSRKKHKTPCPLFLFIPQGEKEKANKKKTPKEEFRALRSATAVSPAAHDKLLKKLDQNFQ